MAQSPIRGIYDQPLDRASAYETLQARAAAAAAPAAAAPVATPQTPAPRRSNRQGLVEAFATSMIRTVGTQIGRELMRGMMGSLRRR